MGCYNIDCAFSGMPIEAGTKMRAFILARTDAHIPPSLFTPTTRWSPVTTGIVGTYDEYGRIENIEPSAAFDIGARHFFNYDGHADALINDIRRPEETAHKINLRHFVYSFGCPADIAFVREDVYQTLIRMNYNHDYYNPAVNTNYVPDIVSIQNELGIIKSTINQHNQSGTKKNSYLYSQIGNDLWDDKPFDKEFSFFSLFMQGEGDILYSALEPYRAALIGQLSTKEDTPSQGALELATVIAEHLHLNRVLKGVAKTWAPSTMMVGQNHPFALHYAFNTAMMGIARAEIVKKIGQDDSPEWYAVQRKIFREP